MAATSTDGSVKAKLMTQDRDRAVAGVLCAAFVAGHDAPLIDERAATPAANDATRDARARQYIRLSSSPFTMRRLSANASQRAGAARWEVVMRTAA